MIKLIIFDWDDVLLLGSKYAYYACYRETLSELGVVLDEQTFHHRIQKRWGQPFREELRELLAEHPDLLDKATDIFLQKKFYGSTFINALTEIPRLSEVLNRLKKQYTLAVATGNQPEMIQKIMRQFDIPYVFSTIITAHDHIPPEKTKPHPFMLEFILNKEKIDPKDALFVGDAKNDVLMARNAAVEPVVVLTGHLTKMEAVSLGVTYILPDVTHIEKVLLKLDR